MFLSKHNSNTIEVYVLQRADMFWRCQTTEGHGRITERAQM